MEQKKIFSLIDKFEQSQLTKLEIRDGDFSIKMENTLSAVPASVPAPQPVQPIVAEEKVKDAANPFVCVKAPIVGVFYAAPAPDQPPYVKVGDKVEAGQVLCLVEAMKMMNELKAPVDGIIQSIGGTNGELVEYDQILFEVEPC